MHTQAIRFRKPYTSEPKTPNQDPDFGLAISVGEDTALNVFCRRAGTQPKALNARTLQAPTKLTRLFDMRRRMTICGGVGGSVC